MAPNDSMHSSSIMSETRLAVSSAGTCDRMLISNSNKKGPRSWIESHPAVRETGCRSHQPSNPFLQIGSNFFIHSSVSLDRGVGEKGHEMVGRTVDQCQETRVTSCEREEHVPHLLLASRDVHSHESLRRCLHRNTCLTQVLICIIAACPHPLLPYR